MGKDWEYVPDPIAYVQDTEGLSNLADPKQGELERTKALDTKMSKLKSEEVISAEPKGEAQWSKYNEKH